VLRELDLIKVKGKENPVGVFEALDFCFDGTCEFQRRTLSSFAAGIKRYRARDFRGALSAFADALDATPGDAPSQVYVQRCKDYLAAPPPEDWDGVWVMHEK
jgi:adenylate cyclase